MIQESLLKSSKTEKKLVVRIAENQLEIERALALRYDVFNLEMGEGLPASSATRKDRDEYDLFCDHLVVIDENNNNAIVGTYRILKRSVAKENIGFYSENEFEISKIYDLKEEVAEIGRSCVHPDYRDGSVISLLWSGLADYMVQKDVRYLMGCGSFHSTSGEVASQVYAFLKHKNGLAEERFHVLPNAGFEVPGFNPNLEIEDIKAITKNVPPLIKGYLRAGALICGYPAIDNVFKTIDVFILFDLKNISEKYGKHYLEKE